MLRKLIAIMSFEYENNDFENDLRWDMWHSRLIVMERLDKVIRIR
jgi:hypothetical protein